MIVLRWAWRLIKAIFGLVVTMLTLGLSLLPLTALLVALPAVSPNEAVLTPTVTPARSWVRRTVRRLAALAGGVGVLVAVPADHAGRQDAEVAGRAGVEAAAERDGAALAVRLPRHVRPRPGPHARHRPGPRRVQPPQPRRPVADHRPHLPRVHRRRRPA